MLSLERCGVRRIITLDNNTILDGHNPRRSDSTKFDWGRRARHSHRVNLARWIVGQVYGVDPCSDAYADEVAWLLAMAKDRQTLNREELEDLLDWACAKTGCQFFLGKELSYASLMR